MLQASMLRVEQREAEGLEGMALHLAPPLRLEDGELLLLSIDGVRDEDLGRPGLRERLSEMGELLQETVQEGLRLVGLAARRLAGVGLRPREEPPHPVRVMPRPGPRSVP